MHSQADVIACLHVSLHIATHAQKQSVEMPLNMFNGDAFRAVWSCQ